MSILEVHLQTLLFCTLALLVLVGIAELASRIRLTLKALLSEGKEQ